MANVIINDQYLTDIASAIREKNGTENTYKPRKMAAAILELDTSGGGDTSLTEVRLETMDHLTYGGTWDAFISEHGDILKFRNCKSFVSAFAGSSISDMSMHTVKYRNTEEIQIDAQAMCQNCYSIEHLFEVMKDPVESTAPIYFTGARYMCQNTESLKELPASWGEDVFDFSQFIRADYAFNGCNQLRTVPPNFLKGLVNRTSGHKASQLYNYGFTYCYTLDRLDKLPTEYGDVEVTTNMFNGTFGQCHRLNGITFHMPGKVPAVSKWTNQVIDLGNGSYVGYTGGLAELTNYGMAAENEVTDADTYAALKDTADWWTQDVNYSRYNHDSAVETINSLPDTSSFGGNNTISFEALSGTLTDGGAVGNLTEEEIAVAAAKGWTVSLT